MQNAWTEFLTTSEEFGIFRLCSSSLLVLGFGWFLRKHGLEMFLCANERCKDKRNYLILCVPYRALRWIYHSRVNQQHTHLWSCFVCLFLFAPACFGHSRDNLQGVSQYKRNEYNRSHIKYILEFSKILSIIKVAFKRFCTIIMETILENSVIQFVWFLLYTWHLFSRTPWRWSHERSKLATTRR
jgi:hypothetical protein